MRSRSLVLLLALAGTALSGCASGFDSTYTQSSIPGQPGAGSTTDTGGDGISGDTNGTGVDNEVTLGSGATTIAYVNGARSIDGSGKTLMTVTNLDEVDEFATVSVDPGTDMGFTGTISLPIYKQLEGAETHPTTSETSEAQLKKYNFLNLDSTAGGYKEYRKINSQTDAELQVWNFEGGNYAAHFRDVKKNQDAWFFGGQGATDSENIASRTDVVDYKGSYAGTATTAGWSDATNYQSANGEWRFNGIATLQANFGNATLKGELTPRYWEKFENGNLVQIDTGLRAIIVDPNTGLPMEDADGTLTDDPVAGTLIKAPPKIYVVQDGATVAVDAENGDVQAFHTATIELDGTISGNTISGTSSIISSGAEIDRTSNQTRIENNDFVNGDSTLQAGFYGTNAEQVTGVFATYGVLPDPVGGDTGINDDRRATIDIQGVFQGQDCTGSCLDNLKEVKP